MTLSVLALAAMASSVPAMGAPVTVSRPTLSAEAAKVAVAACETYARRQGWAMTIAVIDAVGDQIAFLRMDGTPKVTIDFAHGKARTALLMKAPSDMPLKMLESGKMQVLAWDMLPAKGGLPFVIDGQTVGAIGASGEADGRDVECAQAGVDAVNAMRAAK